MTQSFRKLQLYLHFTVVNVYNTHKKILHSTIIIERDLVIDDFRDKCSTEIIDSFNCHHL